MLANEVADALPVHRLRLTDEGWMEAYVCWTDDRFGWRLDALTADAEASFRELARERIDFATHDIVEVSPAATIWFRNAVERLERGYAVVIDYGYPAAQLYRDHRLEGTLRGYAGHTVTDDPFVRVGRQDLTSHVDFTALRRAGDAAGLDHAGYTTQGAFMSSLGLGDVLARLQQDPATTVEDYLAAQAVILRLIDPGGLGRFGVMIMGRNAPMEPPLRGFEIASPEF
jgi:SAM-dependent MidA family methyltransferase